MKADWRARLEAEYEAGTGLSPNKADWLDGRWAGIKAVGADTTTIRAAARPASTIGGCSEIGIGLTTVPQGLQPAQDDPALPRDAAQDDRDRRGHRLGDGRGARLRHAVRRGPSASGCPARTCERGTFSQRHSVLIDQETEKRYMPLKHIREGQGTLRGHQLDAVGRGGARLRIRLFARRAEGARRCGRRSSATSPMARRWCSTSSSPRASANGCACRASSACCRTAMRARGRNIPPPASSAICRCAPRTTCRSPTARRRRIISTSCGGSSSATSASR